MDDDIGVGQPRQVEGLGHGGTGDDAVFALREQLGQGDVFLAGGDDVVVDLVGHDPHAVVQAQLPHPPQLLLAPHPAGGVVGGAQQEQGGLGVLHLLLEVGEVDLIPLGALHQPVLHRDAVGAPDLIVEGAVDGGLDQHLVPLVGHDLDQVAQGGDDAVAVEHIL